jgi:hypothetical protein
MIGERENSENYEVPALARYAPTVNPVPQAVRVRPELGPKTGGAGGVSVM